MRIQPQAKRDYFYTALPFSFYVYPESWGFHILWFLFEFQRKGV